MLYRLLFGISSLRNTTCWLFEIITVEVENISFQMMNKRRKICNKGAKKQKF